jgi:hypothetical protein
VFIIFQFYSPGPIAVNETARNDRSVAKEHNAVALKVGDTQSTGSYVRSQSQTVGCASHGTVQFNQPICVIALGKRVGARPRLRKAIDGDRTRYFWEQR